MDDRKEYERGVTAGEINARLANHDRHFESINGNIASVAHELAEVKLALQRLADQAVARDSTVVATALALKEAEEARRGKSEQSWSPLARVIAVVGVLAAVAGVAVAWWATRR